MTDRRPSISKINERRQIHNRINELKASCEELKLLKSDLSSRLSKLNEAADNLVNDKGKDNHGSDLREDPFDVEAPSQQKSHHECRERNFTSTLITNDLNDNRFCSRRDREQVISSLKVYPSDSFKTKLAHCLHEVVDKAEEIVDLTQNLAAKSDTF